MKVLLHSCCGPCASACVPRLKALGHEVTMLYANSNIDTEEEFERRRAAAETLAKAEGVEMAVAPYDHEEWKREVAAGFENEPEKGARCARCFRYNLAKTAAHAKAHGFDAFTTSLTVSPHKVSETVFAASDDPMFLKENFKKREGFKRSLARAAELGLYRQSYCGCEFSKRIVNSLLLVILSFVCAFSQPCFAASKNKFDDGERKPTKAELAAKEKERKEREKRRKKRDQEERREAMKRPKNGKVVRDEANPLVLDIGKPSEKTTAKTFAPFRTTPRFTGEFPVDVVIVAFPDCEEPPSAERIVDDLSSLSGGYTIKDYYVEYSQGITWPKLYAYDAVYMAPHPLGYYCRYNDTSNRIGFKDPSDGGMRAGKLKRDAVEYAKKTSSPRGRGPSPIMTCVFCNRLDAGLVSNNVEIRDEYPKPDEDWEFDPIQQYKPPIPWADPLWPNSSVQLLYPCNGGVMVHELGHTLGSPDYYHSSEEHDGIPGGPDLHSYGPTGPGYNRYIYHAFAPKECFPTFTSDGTYTLDARSSPINREAGAEKPVLGCFIPSAHPNYVFQLEYVHKDKRPVGNVDYGGLMVNVINVTPIDHMLGSPDLCYTYRRGDPYLKGLVSSDPFLREGDTFDMNSDPAAIIPPLIPGGIEISGIRFDGAKCHFKLRFTKTNQDSTFLKKSLLPKVMLTEVDEVLPTSFRAHCDIVYRGEPLVKEYGFVWSDKPNPTVANNRYPLYHRDRYDARILGLKPGAKYYVRAYVKNANGVTYSKKTEVVTTPKTVSEVPPLLTDHFEGNGYIMQHRHATHVNDMYCDSANATITLMSLGSYYGTMPGGKSKGGPSISIRDVHTSPAEGRPKFRLESYGKYYEAMDGLARAAGLYENQFVKFSDWRKKCVKALKIKQPNDAFVKIDSPADLEAQRPKIKEWLDKSQPVLLLRENNLMPGITDPIFPLDFAIIDGYDDSGNWHVYFPLGCDRGEENTRSGYHTAETLMIEVVEAHLMYWSLPVSSGG